MNKREEIPKLLEQAHSFSLLSQKMVQRVLNEYQTMSEQKIEKVYNFLSKSIAEYQKENTEKITKGKEKTKEIHQRIKEIHYQESISRNQELAELSRIEEELNNIIIQ